MLGYAWEQVVPLLALVVVLKQMLTHELEWQSHKSSHMPHIYLWWWSSSLLPVSWLHPQFRDRVVAPNWTCRWKCTCSVPSITTTRWGWQARFSDCEPWVHGRKRLELEMHQAEIEAVAADGAISIGSFTLICICFQEPSEMETVIT
jgi:hypothetical protein